MSRYVLSPEFHRNLWVQFSPFRLWAMPVLVGLGALSVINMQGDSYRLLMYLSLVAYWLVVVVWGCHAAGAAVQDEVRNNTWDFQRISSISPVKYAFGKFFGVTSYVWYFGLALWAVFAAAYYLNVQAMELAKPPEAGLINGVMAELMKKDYLGDFLYISFFMLLAGVFGHACSFYEGCRSLTRVDKWKNHARWRGNIRGFLLGLIAGTAIFVTLVTPGMIENAVFKFSLYDKFPNVRWYDASAKGIVFIILSLLFFAGWLLVAICRFMKEALMHKTWPAAWPLFVVTLIVYLCGYIDSGAAQMRVGYAVALVLTYAVMFRDAMEPNMYRRLHAAWRAKDHGRMLQNAPLWTTSFPLILLFFFGVLAAAAGGGQFAGTFSFTAALLLFALRDGLVVHALLWRRGRDRFMIFAYYIIVYFLVPNLHMGASLEGIFSFLQNVARKDEASSWILAAYYPTAYDAWHVSLLPPLLEAVAAGWLLRWSVTRKS